MKSKWMEIVKADRESLPSQQKVRVLVWNVPFVGTVD